MQKSQKKKQKISITTILKESKKLPENNRLFIPCNTFSGQLVKPYLPTEFSNLEY